MLDKLAVLAIIIWTAAAVIPVRAADDQGHELLKVDLGCPRAATTFKDGWTRWWLNGGCEGDALGSLLFENIADSGIDATLAPVGGTANLQASSGDPIANTTFTWQHPRERFGPRYMHSDELEPVSRQFGLSIELSFSGPGLTAGEYILKSYHNVSERRRRRDRPGTGPKIAAIGALGPGVTQLKTATDVPIQNERKDDKLVPSEIRFRTDGSGPVTIMYFAGEKSNAALNAFCLYSLDRPQIAHDPSPADGAEGVSPNVKLSWKRRANAAAYNIYIRRELRDVFKVKSGDINFAGRVKGNTFDAGELLMGHKYYWRVDGMSEEDPNVGRRTWKTGSGGMFKGYDPNIVSKGRTWSFTVVDGKAKDPYPLDTAINVPVDTKLKWKAGPLAVTHKVYFGTNWEAVSDYAEPVYVGKATEFKPGPLEKVKTYYWRVDELHGDKTVTGDIWQFMTEGTLAVQVDLAVPKWNSAEPMPETAKPGWTVWADPGWADLYSHDGKKLKDVAGTPIDFHIALGYEGMGCLKAKGLRMYSRAGGGPPSGKVIGDPLCNTWFESADWASYGTGPTGGWGNVLLLISELPAGVYELYSYHNHFYHCDRYEDSCLGIVKFRGGFYQTAGEQGPMPAVRVTALPRKSPPGYDHWGFGPGTGKGVEAIQNAYNVSATHVDDDWKLSPSLVKFRTDGSPVLVIYEAPRDYWDYREYPGGRAILNAFRLMRVAR
ncbi:MAG: hypothetical protein ACYS83_04180 [Planctomycetota bacterium]|jgi:hypothetical protein